MQTSSLIGPTSSFMDGRKELLMDVVALVVATQILVISVKK